MVQQRPLKGVDGIVRRLRRGSLLIFFLKVGLFRQKPVYLHLKGLALGIRLLQPVLDIQEPALQRL